ncbi:MAG TPA: SGNH/GDSL hydrolase family protein [Vicinamibacterales bacterium]|nr:SGNH/GDSL hydrolase family protein [Vicinamibacterales bacterium]
MGLTHALLLATLQLQAAAAPLSFGSSGAVIRYVVLGDSTAAGVGAPYEDGIAVQTARHLGETSQVTMHNFGVSGARMRDVLEKQLAQAEALRPNLVLLSVAANDVTHLTSIPSMRRRLREIVQRLRAANPDVRIVVTGAPDMGSPPRIPWLLRWVASLRTKMVNRMFKSEVASLNLVFAPIAEQTGPLFREDRTLFHADRFHPNARGYATWVVVLNQALPAAPPRQP